jgi:hypothetical protein
MMPKTNREESIPSLERTRALVFVNCKRESVTLDEADSVSSAQSARRST